jgi:DNA-binding NtrC family response regulator
MTILIADDHREFCTALGSIITEQGWNWHAVHTPTDALNYLQEHNATIAVMLLDVEFHHPTLSGLNVLEVSRRLYPQLPIIMISGESTFQEVIKATRMGAVNFIPKSDVNRDKVRQILLTEVERLKRKTSEAELLAFMELQGFIGKSKAMMAVGEKIVRYGKTELSVLVTIGASKKNGHRPS